MTVLAAHRWPTNAHLIADVAKLGYLDGMVLDPTYGHGKFWTLYTPKQLVATDLDPSKSPSGRAIDFTDLPWCDDVSFDAVVLDPPYKLNGTPDPIVDERYGTHVSATWQGRMELCRLGIIECARVLRPGGHLLVKCQDQVCSGAIRWQTLEFTDAAETYGGCRLIDRFDLLGKHRPQPMNGRQQQHAHGRPSTLLVFKREGP